MLVFAWVRSKSFDQTTSKSLEVESIHAVTLEMISMSKASN